MLKTVFMGTPEIAKTILEKLCEKNLTPIAVVTQTAKATGRGQKIQASPVEIYAKEKNIPVISTDNVSLSPTFEELEKLKPDLILVAAFGQILKDHVLNLPKIA